jgi:hypothetical protein
MPGQARFRFQALRRHAEGRDPPVAQEGRPFPSIRAIGAILGPRKATLRGWSSTLRGLRRLPADQAAVRAEPDLVPNGRPLRSVVIAVVEGAGDHRFSSRSFGSQLNGSAESVKYRPQSNRTQGKTGGRLSIACRSPAVGVGRKCSLGTARNDARDRLHPRSAESNGATAPSSSRRACAIMWSA